MQTPADLSIHPRDIAFGRGAAPIRWWMGGDPVATAFYNALSASFPQGERFFIDAVRRFRDAASPALQEQIKAFTTQESIHSREHVFFNQQATAAGYDLTKINRVIDQRLSFGRSLPAVYQLAATMALEHFTAVLAHAVLSDPRHMEQAPPDMQRMWRWHAIEEVEHKGVAFDTWMAARKDSWGLTRWFARVRAMFMATVIFCEFIVRGTKLFLEQDNINNVKSWFRLFTFLFVKPGLFRQVLGAYFAFYLPGFHPWHVDDRQLVAEVDRELRTNYAIS
jgi:predicted metal-dependent hydrolase